MTESQSVKYLVKADFPPQFERLIGYLDKNEIVAEWKSFTRLFVVLCVSDETREKIRKHCDGIKFSVHPNPKPA